MKFIRGCENYIWVYGHYIGDIQAFLAYSYHHPELTEQDWKDLGWVEDYEQWRDDISYVDLEGLVNGIASGTFV